MTAILILALLAFMGLMLLQSSTTEFGQASTALHSARAFQIAEAAADEAFAVLNDQLKEQPDAKMEDLRATFENSWKYQFLKQGCTADFADGPAAQKIRLLDKLPNLARWVGQTQALIAELNDNRFTIDSVEVYLKDMRPIDHTPYQLDAAQYVPIDRNTQGKGPFDAIPDESGVKLSRMTRDYRFVAQVEAKVSWRDSRRHTIKIVKCRDCKILNVGPVAKSHSLYMVKGPHRYDEFSMGDGRLFLFNHPFQSRIYVHGPAVMYLHNADLDPALCARKSKIPDPRNAGIVLDETRKFPSMDHMFQYGDTYCGFSYVPWQGRAFFDNPQFRTGDYHNDMDGTNPIQFKTAQNRGYLPGESTWSNLVKAQGSSYVRGTVFESKFMPAGFYCRAPWKFVGGSAPSPYNPNSTIDPTRWPVIPDDPENERNQFVIEHAWHRTGDQSLFEKSKIRAEVMQYKFLLAWQVTNQGMANPEFTLSYGNIRDGFWRAAWADICSFFSSTLFVPKLAWDAIVSGYHAIWPPGDPVVGRAEPHDDNSWPVNWKYFWRSGVRYFADETQIPRDPQGAWVFDGIYWVRKFKSPPGGAYYIGKGMIVCTGEPGDCVVGGSIVPKVGPGGDERRYYNTSHLTLVYWPYSTTGALDPAKAQVVFDGKGHVFRGCLVSRYGVKTTGGATLTHDKILAAGADHNAEMAKWKTTFKMSQIKNDCNQIWGNLVVEHLNKQEINGDLIIYHDVMNPAYARQTTANGTQMAEIIEDYNKEEQSFYHTAHLSPKLQYFGMEGATSDRPQDQ